MGKNLFDFKFKNLKGIKPEEVMAPKDIIHEVITLDKLKPKVWINAVEFNNGLKIPLNRNDIVVFVGPNNSGKSASLKEMSSLLRSVNNKTNIITEIKYNLEGNENSLIDFFDKNALKESDGSSIRYKGLGFNIGSSAVKQNWQEKTKGISNLVDVFTTTLTTEERLKAANPAESIKLTSEPPEHPIHFLQMNDNIEGFFCQYFNQAFGIDLILHRNAGGEVPLYVGKIPEAIGSEDRLSYSYQSKIEKLDLLHKQGDGMRSFVGVLLNAFVSNKSILFLDEPEAFLHPPQARLLGKMLAKDLPSERQLFLATHSTDFLKGLLEFDNPNLKIIRIQRDGITNIVNVLNNTEINSIWGDSLLRHSNILDGLFHNQVVICESDSDNRFYSAMLSSINMKKSILGQDTLFLHCGGKHRIPIVIKALKQLNVTIKVIVDFDVLNNQTPLKDIYEMTGGDWNNIKNDWKIVKDAIESKKPELEVADLKTEIDAIFQTINEKNISKEKISEINRTLKKASAWSYAKEVGRGFIPSGDAISAFDRMQQKLKDNGVFVVEVGELEGFVKSVGNHGPKWVNDVLTKDLAEDPELSVARDFILEVNSQI